MELYWWSIEVFDGAEMSAARWQDSYGNVLVEAAIAHGAYEWQWHRHSWGVLFEIGFRNDERWPTYRDLPVVRAALDAVPDPVNGLMVYPGRGGSSGRVEPRRPRPIAGAGAAPIPVEPVQTEIVLAAPEPPATTASPALLRARQESASSRPISSVALRCA
jgi:hypothetical protein